MQIVTIKAPLSGVIFPLEEVPDPVFAEKMVGDGISIDPSSNILYAPIDGIITHIHNALHAITITHDSGLEVMMHIGLDTVLLQSKGFKLISQKSQKVQIGDKLIEFDMDFVDKNAKSLLTQIILTNDDIVDSIEKSDGYAECSKTTLMRVILKKEFATNSQNHADKESLSQKITISNPNGLHARPAATLASLSKQYIADISILKGGVPANAKSITSIMKLDIRYGDEIELKVVGIDAQNALDEILQKIENRLGEEIEESTISRDRAATEDRSISENDDPNRLIGISVSDGISLGIAIHINMESFEFEEYANDSEYEIEKLKVAITNSKDQLDRYIDPSICVSSSDIFTAHKELLNDIDIMSTAKEIILDGKSAEFGWSQACSIYAKELESSDNRLLAQRASDIRDIEHRVLRLLTNVDIKTMKLPEYAILLAEEITPSFLTSIDIARVKGLCMVRGGASSHVAILARSMNIPTIMGMGRDLLDIDEGESVLIDTATQSLTIDPSQKLIDSIQAEQLRIENVRVAELENALQSATTTDDISIDIVANIGSIEDAISSIEFGGEGVGLLRSEFLFLSRPTSPTEDEQFEIYKDILLALKGRPLTIRTLDVGGDKPLPYLPLPLEENPFLGIRGVRVGLQIPDILRVQIRAILRAKAYGEVRIMFPMVTTIDEIKKLKEIVEEERASLAAKTIDVGIMVEVPSTAILAKHFAKEVDFFSIGTNDLTQYTLAMDRGHPQLASKLDTLDPSVLRLIKMTVDGAKSEGKRVAICGSIASDSFATPLLIGLGIEELSIIPTTIPAIKTKIRTYSFDECINAASKALECGSSQEVRRLIDQTFSDSKLNLI